MKTIMSKIQRFKKIRLFHTIISQEIIKPSFPTPPHLKLHNLSMLDHIQPNVHVPWIFFYKNYNIGDINILKKSLSKCLTQYYPFAGRYPGPYAPQIKCNDEGVEFLEASINKSLHEFILKRDLDQTLMNKLVPHSLGCAINKTGPNVLEVQLNHFTCGGVALAVTISHKAADALTLINFVKHWATVTRGGSPLNPTFISSPIKDAINLPDISWNDDSLSKDKYVERRLMFPNSKLSELKNKINAMGITPLNPSRAESLTSLLFKCAVNAATKISGSFKPSNLFLLVNMRGNITSLCPKSAAGNVAPGVIAKMDDSDQIQLNEVITCLRKERMELPVVKDIDELIQKSSKTISTVLNDQSSHNFYIFSSVCNFPFYEVDFGWGNPERIVLLTSKSENNHFAFMDTASGDGIEAIIHLKEEEMAVLQNDNELLAYVEDMS